METFFFLIMRDYNVILGKSIKKIIEKYSTGCDKIIELL